MSRFRIFRNAGVFLAAGIATLATAAPDARAQQGPDSPVKWIDVHVHPAGGVGRRTDYAGSVDAILEAMKDSNMAKAILMPTPQSGTAKNDPWTLEDFLSIARKYPDRLAVMGGGGTLNTMIHNDSPDGKVSEDLKAKFRRRAERIVDQGAVGFGEISILHIALIQNHPYESVAGDHPLLLLLADIAAERNVVIDIHFDPVTEDIRTADWLEQPPNPPLFKRNLDGFERLLAHNRKAVIVWAHAGSDNIGHWTPELTRDMLAKHPNLYMSLRMTVGRGGFRMNHPLFPKGIKPAWLGVFKEFPDRFVLGGDQFFVSAGNRGPAATFGQYAATIRKRTNLFLARLPPDIARKIGYDNAMRIYRLKP